ncbi:EscS/YscS/HrcS family type III secretion system export apparatus protein [Pararobbsia silviterrae]|uniref:EscS/YscS/HrcS family type III secretion system export apparatus protein n=1 Tax=Pararobbsia silviterrae TaxID=1792498 RepID=A0A494XQF2_9BURK|nr:EscS/YscS/HrcS family type III secretion system export apparatus protein [Pararobbsia silviterrae]RKP50344.1 EscS/YscS/HrcS family type III secretion system export apparatus protein [Pararobbsia silviterrae]
MNDIVQAGQQAIWLVMALSAWPVAVATLIGLIVGAFQTIVQLQEQTLPFGVKLIGIGLCLYIGSGWAGSKLVAWSVELMRHALARASI